jgi:hypothetical protein
MPSAWYVYIGLVGDLPPMAAGNWILIEWGPGASQFFESVVVILLFVISFYYPESGPVPYPFPIAPLSMNIQSYITMALTTSSEQNTAIRKRVSLQEKSSLQHSSILD